MSEEYRNKETKIKLMLVHSILQSVFTEEINAVYNWMFLYLSLFFFALTKMHWILNLLCNIFN